MHRVQMDLRDPSQDQMPQQNHLKIKCVSMCRRHLLFYRSHVHCFFRTGDQRRIHKLHPDFSDECECEQYDVNR